MSKTSRKWLTRAGKGIGVAFALYFVWYGLQFAYYHSLQEVDKRYSGYATNGRVSVRSRGPHLMVYEYGRDGGPAIYNAFDHPVRAAALGPEGNLLAAAGGNRVKLWRLDRGGLLQGRKLLLDATCDFDAVDILGFTSDGKFLVAVGEDKEQVHVTTFDHTRKLAAATHPVPAASSDAFRLSIELSEKGQVASVARTPARYEFVEAERDTMTSYHRLAQDMPAAVHLRDNVSQEIVGSGSSSDRWSARAHHPEGHYRIFDRKHGIVAWKISPRPTPRKVKKDGRTFLQ